MSATRWSKQHPQEKYTALVRHLGTAIRSGALGVGDQLPSFAELQRQFTVTPNTVNRALLDLEHEGLIIRRRGRGVFVADRKHHSTVDADRRGIIGACGFGFAGCSSYWATILAGMGAVAQRANVQILLFDSTSLDGWEKVDGVVVCDWPPPETIRHIPPEQPRVSLLAPIEGVASVCVDEYAASRAATEYLLALGHTRIAYLHSKSPPVAARIAGYCDALNAAGLPCDPALRRALPGGINHGDEFSVAGRIAMREWLGDNRGVPPFTAVLSHNDETAIGIVEALRYYRLAVPGDVSVVGYDGLDIGAYCAPRLTTLQIPLRDLGALAVELLLKKLAGEAVEDRLYLSSATLLERESTRHARATVQTQSVGT